MAPKFSGDNFREGRSKAAGGEARRSAAHTEQQADGQRVGGCSADAETKTTQEEEIKLSQNYDPEVAGEEKQGQEAGRDRNKLERQANCAAQNAASHHGKAGAAGGKLHAAVVKAGGQSAQSAGTVKAGASLAAPRSGQASACPQTSREWASASPRTLEWKRSRQTLPL